MGPIFGNRRFIFFAVTILFIFGFVTISSSDFDRPMRRQRDARWVPPFKVFSNNDRQIANGTLGFGAIYALGLPDRYDKRDSMQLAASLTGLRITWQDGVQGDKMNPKAVPPKHSDPESTSFKMDGEVGCWRGHMNILQRIVKDSIASALIVEDDADWDVHIVQQMQQLSIASKKMLADQSQWSRKNHEHTNSPYGEGWDLLWIGHCGGWPSQARQNASAIIHDDYTVPPSWDMLDLLKDFPTNTSATCSAHEGRDPPGKVCDAPRLAANERIVQENTSPLCTTGYAVSLQGAKKMLARLGGISLVDVNGAIDVEMTQMCRGNGPVQTKREAARCLTVSPPYLTSHRSKGLVIADSDIRTMGATNETRAVGSTMGIRWPTRLNIENLIAGYEPESQYVPHKDGGERYREANEYQAYIGSS